MESASAPIEPAHIAIDAEQAGIDRQMLAKLTPAQVQVLTLTARGLTAKEIGRELGCAERTVYTHRADITRRTGLHGKAAMTVFAVRAGLLKP